MNTSSHLLRAVEQLDQGVLNSALLALLDAGTSKSLALACKPLSDICHSSQTRLSFADGGAIPLVPERFPYCSRVHATVTCKQDLDVHFPALLALLTRFEHLSHVKLHVACELTAVQHTAVLQRLALQLTKLQTLQVDLGDEAAWCPEAWQTIATLPHLQQLSVKFETNLHTNPFWIGDLKALAPLGSSLQHLEISADVSSLHGTCRLDCSWLQELTQLTLLSLPLFWFEDVSSAASCTALHSLRLCLYTDRIDEIIGPKFCSALQHLSQLTELVIKQPEDYAFWSSSHSPSVGPRCRPCLWQVLSHLLTLRFLELPSFCWSSVTILSVLTNLTSVKGAWTSDPSQEEMQEWQLPAARGAAAASAVVQPQQGKHTTTCASIWQLCGRGNIPFGAFPALTSFTYGPPKVYQDMMCAADLRRLACSCTSLQEISILPNSRYKPAKASLESSDVTERLAAIGKLGTLQHLTWLQFAVDSDNDLAALVELQQVQDLFLVLPTSSVCSVQALMQLNEMKGLQKLDLRIFALERMSLTQSQTLELIKALCKVTRVNLGVSVGTMNTVLAAWASVVAMGLPSAGDFKVYDASAP